MSKTTGLVAALGAFGALAYLMAPLPPDEPPTEAAVAATSAVAARRPPASPSATVARVSPAAPALPARDATIRLVEQIQTELQRLGCYSGAVDGRWSAETQRAMLELGERVRVLRPVGAPDYIMLALARSQRSHLCAEFNRASASRQPARVVPMTGGWDATNERLSGATAQQRHVERALSKAGSWALASNQTEDRAAARDGRSTARPPTLMTEEGNPPPSGRLDLEQVRMGLGAANVDPLSAGAVARDGALSAPPDRGLPIPPQMAGQHAPGNFDAIQSPRRTQRAAAEVRGTGRASAAEWKRTVFSKMRFEGP